MIVALSSHFAGATPACLRAQFDSMKCCLITVLGLCFGFCLLVVNWEYSMVLGAF